MQQLPRLATTCLPYLKIVSRPSESLRRFVELQRRPRKLPSPRPNFTPQTGEPRAAPQSRAATAEAPKEIRAPPCPTSLAPAPAANSHRPPAARTGARHFHTKSNRDEGLGETDLQMSSEQKPKAKDVRTKELHIAATRGFVGLQRACYSPGFQQHTPREPPDPGSAPGARDLHPGVCNK